METVEKYSVKGKVIAILRNTNMVIYYWLRSRIGKDRAKRIAMFVLLTAAVHKKINCDIKKKEARRA